MTLGVSSALHLSREYAKSVMKTRFDLFVHWKQMTWSTCLVCPSVQLSGGLVGYAYTSNGYVTYFQSPKKINRVLICVSLGLQCNRRVKLSPGSINYFNSCENCVILWSVLLYFDTTGAHISYFQRPKRRSIGFFCVFSQTDSTEEEQNYHQGH